MVEPTSVINGTVHAITRGCAHHFMFHLTPEMHKLQQEAEAPLGLTASTRLLAMHVRLGDVYMSKPTRTLPTKWSQFEKHKEVAGPKELIREMISCAQDMARSYIPAPESTNSTDGCVLVVVSDNMGVKAFADTLAEGLAPCRLLVYPFVPKHANKTIAEELLQSWAEIIFMAQAEILVHGGGHASAS